MIKLMAAFIAALPEIIRLIKNIEKRIQQEKLDRKIKDDIRKINNAFDNKDAESLNNIFAD